MSHQLFTPLYPEDLLTNREMKGGTSDSDKVEKQPRTCPYCTEELVKAVIVHEAERLVKIDGEVITKVGYWSKERMTFDIKEEVWVCPECKTIIR